MALNVVDWNIDPNLKWYISLSESGGTISVSLYDDDPSGTGVLTATGSCSTGTAVSVELTEEDGANETLLKFNDGLEYHMKVSGSGGDPSITYQVGPFSDLEDIEDPIYQSEDLVSLRATKEIMEHTRTKLNRQITMSVFENDVDIGEVVSLSTSRESLSELGEASEINIMGTPDSVIKTIRTTKYVRFYNL